MKFSIASIFALTTIVSSHLTFRAIWLISQDDSTIANAPLIVATLASLHSGSYSVEQT
jgi:hypothetical protein